MSILVIGGAGALGRELIRTLRSKNQSSITSIDLFENQEAHLNILISKDSSVLDQTDKIEAKLSDDIKAIYCVAGGWQGGSLKDDCCLSNCQLMWKQNVESSLLAAHLAVNHSKYLKIEL